MHFFLWTFILMISFSQIQSAENVPQNNLIKKIYICSEQLYVENNKILAYINENWEEVNQINSDENGLFLYYAGGDKIGPAVCKFGHPMWCWRCGGCVVRYCKGRCICVTFE